MTEHKRQWISTVHLASRLLMCLSGVVACDASEAPPMAPDLSDPRAGTGAGGSDAGKPNDASTGDSGHLHRDANVGDDTDAGTSDAAVDDDSGAPLDPVSSCAMSAEQAELDRDVYFRDESGFSLTRGVTGFGVAFQSDTCSGIGALPVSASGGYKQPALLFGDCDMVVEDLTLLHLGDGYRVAWIDNAMGSAELRTLDLAESLAVPAEASPVRITNNSLRERRPNLWRLNDASYISWLSGDPNAAPNEIRVQASDGTGSSHALVPAAGGFGPTRFAVAQLGPKHAALVFVSELEQPGVWLQALDTAAKPVGAPVRLSSAVTTGNTLDIADKDGEGGAAVYAVRVGSEEQVRFRRLDETGAPLGAEIKLVGSPYRARDAAITHLANGYAVVFRSLPEGSGTEADIRLMLITKEGNIQRDKVGRLITYRLTAAAAGGGRVHARVSSDGQLLVGFLDIDASSTKFRLVRKRLDCAL